MGLFGGGNSTSSTQNNEYVTNNDNRVGVSDDATLLQNSSVTTNNIDNSQKSTSITTINQTVDPGTLAVAAGIAGDSISFGKDALKLVQSATAASDAKAQAAIDAANQATKALQATTGQALDVNRQVIGAALDATTANQRDTLDAITGNAQRTYDLTQALFSGSVSAITQSVKDVQNQSQNFIEDFTSQLATTQQSESERNFSRIQQLAVVAVIVIVVGMAVVKG